MRCCDRRRHSKLRLSSQKHHRPKPKHLRSLPLSIPLRNITVMKVSIPRNINVLKVFIPLNILSFKVSYPHAAYTDGSVESVNNLYRRIQKSRELPSGSDLCFAYIIYFELLF